MPVSYNRISLTDSIGYSEILDPKLKTNTLRIQFHWERNRLQRLPLLSRC